jgi:hypothetical protein
VRCSQVARIPRDNTHGKEIADLQNEARGDGHSPNTLVGGTGHSHQGAIIWARSAWPAIRVILMLVPFIPFAFILWLIWNRTTLIAWWDEWYLFLPLLQASDAGTLNFAQIWEPAAEHRIVIPRLFALALIELTSWDRQIQMTIYLFIGLAALVLILDAVRRTFGSVNAAVVLAGPTGLIMLSLTQYENWLWPLGLGFIITGFAAALCLWALTARSGWVALLIAAFGALIAALSTAAGPVMWLAFLPAFWLLGRRYFAAWTIGTLAVAASYMTQSSENSVFARRPGNVEDAFRRAKYMLAFLGAPISREHVTLSMVAVVVSGILLLVSIVVLYRLRVDLLILWSWLGMAGFAIGCAILLGMGRASLSPDLSVPSRYDSFSVLWWVAVVALVALGTMQLARAQQNDINGFTGRSAKLLAGANVAALAALLLGFVAANIQGFKQGYAWMDFPIQQQECVLEPQYASDFCLSVFHAQPALARSRILYAQSSQLGIFRGRTPLEVSQLHHLSEPAAGAINAVNRQTLGPRLDGQLDSPSATPTAPESATTKANRKEEKRRSRKKTSTSALAPTVSAGAELVVPAGQYIPVSGWAAMSDTAPEQVGGVMVAVDDSRYVWATYGQPPSATIPESSKVPRTGEGFVAFLPPEALPVGHHTLQLMVLTPNLQSYALVPGAVTIDVQAPPEIDVTDLTEIEQMAFGSIEQINGRLLPNQQEWPYVEPANEPLEITGWAFDTLAVTYARRGFVLVDDRLAFPAQVGLPRGEAAMALHHPPSSHGIDLALVGFRAEIPSGALTPGRHTVEVRLVTQDDRSYFAASPNLTIQIEVR